MSALAVLSEYLGFVGIAIIVYGVACGLVRPLSAEANGLRAERSATRGTACATSSAITCCSGSSS